MTPPEPGPDGEARVLSLDLLRGFSILGILAVNAIGFAQPPAVYSNPAASPLPLSHADTLTWWLIQTFARDKFVTAFSMLFGVSLYLVGRGIDLRVPSYKTTLFRRLGWLAVFGVIHGALIWHGDVLLLYALTGLVFWRWRTAEPRRLLATGAALFLIGAALQTFPAMIQQIQHPDQVCARPDVMRDVVAMRAAFWSSLATNFRIWAGLIPAEIVIFLPTTLGLMMIGLGLFKSGFLRGAAPVKAYVLAIAAGGAALAVIGAQSAFTAAQGFPYPQVFGLYAVANVLLCLPVSLAYASALMLAARTPWGRWLLHPVACAGRMAFSNYLTQSLVMTALFYGGRGGPGWYGAMNPAAVMPMVFVIWTAQLVISPLWLSRFRYGPFEWLWRSLTFNRPVAMGYPAPAP